MVIMDTGPGMTQAYYTWNEWAASLCERAYQKKKPITIQAEETKHGLKIVHVSLDQQEAAS